MKAPIALHLCVNLLLALAGCVCRAQSQTSQGCNVGEDPGRSREVLRTGNSLNLQSPSPCSGNLTAWTYCYHSNSVTEDGRYSMTFRVWRQSDTDSSRYDRVYQYFLSVDLLASTISEPFVCETVSLTPVEYFAVETNDVIGYYSTTFFSRPLYITSDDVMDYTLYEDNRNGFEQFNAQSITMGDMLVLQSVGLHLSANIEVDVPSMSPTAQVQPSPTSTTAAAFTTSTVKLKITTSSLSKATEMTESTTGVQLATTAESLVQKVSLTKQNPAPSVIGTGTPPPNDEASPIAAIIAAVVSFSILTIITSAGIVGLILWRRKRRSFKPKGLGVSNVLSNSIENEVPLSAFPADYEQPDKKNSTTQNGPAYHSHELEGMHHNYDNYTEVEDETLMYSYEGTDEQRATKDKDQDRGSSIMSIYATLKPSDIAYYNLMKEATQGVSPQGTLTPFCAPPSQEDEIYRELSKLQTRRIPRTAIEILGHLGSGQFATVEKGVWSGRQGTLEVAIKTLSHGTSQLDKVKFLQEAAVMVQFIHPNVVQLHGVAKEGDKLMLVIEYLAEGDMRNCLQTMRPIPGETTPQCISQYLLSFSQQVALGMHYLSIKGFVHRDLAARNIFLSRDWVCKIGDFGMSRDLADADYYVSEGGAIPVRWTAPEAVYYRKHSTASDVWSYGCLLYEIWSLGHKPFSGFSNADVIEMVDSGYRNPPPPGCPKQIYELMIKCWHPIPSVRPLFSDILVKLLEDESTVLRIPQEDTSTHAMATILGANLDAAKGMYRKLQREYITSRTKQCNSREKSAVYEDMDGWSSGTLYDDVPIEDVTTDPYLYMQSAKYSTLEPNCEESDAPRGSQLFTQTDREYEIV